MIVEELVSVLGLDIEADDLPKFQKGVLSATGAIGGLIGAAVAGAATLSAMLDTVGETAQSSKFARSIDISFQSLQRLEYAAQQTIGSSGAIKGVLQGLEQSARGAANGLDGGAAVAFARLGVQIHDANGELRSADQLLLDVADAVSRSGNPDLAFTIAEQLGLGPDLNLLLRLGADGINDLGDEAQRLGLILGDGAAKESEEFTEGMKRLRRAGQSLLISVGLPLVEWVNDLVVGFESFRKSESGQEILTAFGDALTFVWDATKLLLEPFKIMTDLFEEFGPIALLALAPLLPILGPIAAGFIAMASPFILTAAAIIALLLALNELRVFFQGGDSLIGRGLEALGFDPNAVRDDAKAGFSNKVDRAKGFFGSIADWASSLFSGAFSSSAPTPAPAGAGGGVINQTNDIRIETSDPVVAGRTAARILEDNVRESVKKLVSPMVK